ncbi:hypothetical protein T4B_14746 [Trichinella pseudospiralis]|uniref:Uncharacterized protein n=1 Tax=Trichinella pseudospiralis TaxID=6337 RepID=A0A0V1GMK3_TRIPS|nr:hypothetical protein T4B_14746 [Trichinella pseudospiralis]
MTALLSLKFHYNQLSGEYSERRVIFQEREYSERTAISKERRLILNQRRLNVQ